MIQNTSQQNMDGTNRVKSSCVIKGKRKLNIRTSYECRLLEFNPVDGPDLSLDNDSDSNDETNKEGNKTTYVNKSFNIQMFGIDEKGRKYSITAINFCPYFYVKVNDSWNNSKKYEFLKFIIDKLPANNSASEIKDVLYVKSKKLYGFDNGKMHRFLVIRFKTMSCYYNVKNLWYTKINGEQKLIEGGLKYKNEKLELYEGHIPPLLRMFHIKDISPSGWIKIQKKYITEITGIKKRTTCDFECIVDYKNIESLREKETPVPYKICSFDIEASSSHGDFPLPIKSYNKLCEQFLDFFESIYFQDYNKNNLLITKQSDINKYFNSEIIKVFLKMILYKSLIHEDNFETKCKVNGVDFSILIKSNLGSEDLFKQIGSLFQKYIDMFIDKTYIKHKFKSFESANELFETLFNKLIVNKENVDISNRDNDFKNEQTLLKFFEKNTTVSSNISNTYDTWGDNDDYHSADENQYESDDESDLESNKTYHMKKSSSQSNIINTLIKHIHYDSKSKLVKLKDHKELCDIINYNISKYFPQVEGDKVTFIGSTFRINGESKPYLNHCLVLNECDNVDGAVIQPCKNEKQLLLSWTRLIQKEDPDIIIGYNIFGFDYMFMFNRVKENNIVEEFLKLSRNKDEICGKMDYTSKQINLNELKIKLASGEYNLYYPQMNGRLQIDLLNYFRREFNLEMYKLDFTAGYFISDKIKNVSYDAVLGKTKVVSKNLIGLENNAYVKIKETSHSDNYYKDGAKFMVSDISINDGYFYLDGNVQPNMNTLVSWCLSKDDVSPQEIFKYTNEGSSKKAIVAKYCIQDCNLVHELFKKTDVITGFIEMASICSVPLSFIVLRGQGIKLTSYISKKCREKNTLMPTLNKNKNTDGYEGAIVLEPKTNLYLDDPVACVDYGSLYPSSMISENLCHSSKVWSKTFDLQGNMISYTGETDDEGNFIYDKLPNMKYVDVEFDTYRYYKKSPKASAVKLKSGKKICRFAQYENSKAILPSVLEELLSQRKAAKKLMAKENDPFMKNIYDKRQLSIKVTANSIYGQTGAAVGDFYEPDVAASTTATGRKLLTYAKRTIEEIYGDNICDTKNYGKVRTNAEYIYGDTDSVFFCFNLKELDGTPIKGQKALSITIELAKEAGALATKFLKKPHDLEYEKTFLPFCLLSKKRYVGMLYEEDPSPNACYRKSMGIVLKRRDNAPIVKDVYGGIIDILMKEQSISKSVDFLNNILENLIRGKIPIEKLIITKSLRGHYANPKQIAHKVLADRITMRDPGNRPTAGDRVPFIYIENKDKNALQGEKIELPEYVKEHGLKIDYSHYITNQIMKPVLQLYALVLEKLPRLSKKPSLILKIKREIEDNSHLEHEKYLEKREKIRCDYVKKYLFDDTLNKLKAGKNGNYEITSMFKPLVMNGE